MVKTIENILVVGSGKVGSLVAILLQNSGFSVSCLDKKKTSPGKNIRIITGDVSKISVLEKKMKGFDAVVSCLPYDLNLNVAKTAYKYGIHYFDLTEDVPTTDAIRKLAKKSKAVMAPQCGLAPGFIAIVGASLAGEMKKLRSIELRVGALPQHPKGLLGYAFNWSSEGVVNEYLNDCTIMKDGQIKTVPAMQDLETIVINGITLEAFTTSGGLGTMCETYKGKVEQLNYKTMRYPGHCKLMRFFFHELLMREDREKAGRILVHAKPPVDDDVVLLHAAVEGWKNRGLERDEYVKCYYPLKINNKEFRAISWTTAASVTAVVELVAKGKLKQKGFIKQEEIKLEDFLKTKAGSLYDRAE